MPFRPVRSLAACFFGVALLASCASPTSSTQLSSASNIQKGRVVAVDPVTAIGTTTGSSATSGTASMSGMASTSGAGGGGMAMAGSPSAVITVAFPDGTENMFAVTQSQTNFKVGDSVSVIRDNAGAVITSP